MSEVVAPGPAYWRLEFDSGRNRLYGRERARESDRGIVFVIGRIRRWRPSDLVQALNEIMTKREAEVDLGPVAHVSVKPHSLFNSAAFAHWCRRRGITITHRETDYFFMCSLSEDPMDTESD